MDKQSADKHPVDIHVGRRVRQRRWMVGMTQQQLAQAVGIKFQQIQKYETGMNRVSASRLWDIARTLNAPVDFFFEGLDRDALGDVALNGATSAPNGAGGAPGSARATRTGGTPLPGDVIADREALELVRSYYAIPEAQRRRLFDLARVLSDVA